MTRPEIESKIRELVRETRRLRRLLPDAPSGAFKGRTRADDRAAKREWHRLETARIRDERMAICGGRCEAPEPMAIGGRCYCPAAEMHHTESGNGRRRQQQSVENVRMFCAFHHRELHRSARERARIEGKGRP